MISNRPCFTVMRNLQIADWNDLMVQTTGYQVSDVKGMKCHEVFSGYHTDGTTFCSQHCRLLIQTENHDVSNLRLTYHMRNNSCGQIRLDYVVLSHPFRIIHILAESETICTEFTGFRLTHRQMEILTKLAEGYRAREISKKLFISPDTVKTHIKRILDTLQVHSQQEAIASYYRKLRNNKISP